MMSSDVGLVAIPMALLLISGEFDLSVGSVYALVPIIANVMYKTVLPNIWITSIISLLMACMFGLANGLLTVKVGIPSFIVTMGTWFFFGSLALIVSGGLPQGIPTTSFYNLGGYVTISGLPFAVEMIWLAGTAVLFYLILEKTRHGNWSMGTGSNKMAAIMMGVKTNRVKIINFMLTSLFAGLLGILDLSRMSATTPTQGTALTFEAIAAAVIGGVSLSGGAGSIIGTLIGSILLGSIYNGLILIGAGYYWFQGFVGAIVVIAAVINLRVAKARGSNA
jgi:ribose/xylose/arabinose/galactoside ABC-type transport system permease subunit